MLKDEYKVYEEKMKKSIESVANDFAAVRAGRANASVLNRIHVDYYGTPTPIQQIASVGSPDPRTLLITPWDASALKAIEKAILESDLGINPQNDGKAIRLRFLGDLSAISPELQALVDRTNEISTHIHGFQANVCLNYGGREEILHAARRFARDCADGTADPDSLTEAGFSDYLYSAGIPDPELIIRTSGEERLSGFLLWQCAYSEFYFCDTLWPDFDALALDKAIIAYQSRDRRFGGVK